MAYFHFWVFTDTNGKMKADGSIMTYGEVLNKYIIDPYKPVSKVWAKNKQEAIRLEKKWNRIKKS